jgi:hypothetical protein
VNRVLVRTRDGVRQKRCTLCLAWKPFDSFNTDRHTAIGRAPRCQDCERARARKNWHGRETARRLLQRPLPCSSETSAVAHLYRTKSGEPAAPYERKKAV